MKKLFLSSVVLITFSFSTILFQISCTKPAEAQTPNGTTNYVLPAATTSSLGGVIVGSGLNVANGILSVAQTPANPSSQIQQGILLIYDEGKFIICQYDGSNKKEIPINLPSGRTVASTAGNSALSPDGKTLFFEAWEMSTTTGFLYSCNIDGSNLKPIYTVSGSYPRIKGAY